MGCCGGDREKLAPVRAEQKWEYINLDDFKSTSCWTYLAYGYLYLMLFISISVYCVDTFTAVNLLVFDRWAGQIKPEIPLSISRWIFAGCIILSFILLFYRWFRAIRVMRQSAIANCYLDPLAIRIESARMGKEGRGWKRFLVFAELTKSRKGADYVALFAHYSFEAWLRIIFAEGPRQVVNAVTLYSVLRLNLIPQGSHAASDGHTPIVQFFVNVSILADKNKEQAVILFSMLWTLVIWVISVINLIVAIILYMVFLWHHIPSADGGLTKYCRRKINTRLERIVKAKVDKALKKENAIRVRQQGVDGNEFKRQPTLPDLGGEGLQPLSRQTTMTTLPEYSSRPQTGRSSGDSFVSREPMLPDVDGSRRPGPPMRSVTQASGASWASYDSNAPLMNEAQGMGYAPSRSQSPAPSASGWGARPMPGRSMTGMSQSSQRPFSPGSGPRPGTGSGSRNTPGIYQMEPLTRLTTNLNSGPVSAGPRSTSQQGHRTPSDPNNPFFRMASSASTQGPPYPPSDIRSPEDSSGRRTPASAMNPYFPPLSESTGRGSPAPTFRQQLPQGPPPSRSYTPNGLPSGRSITSTGRAPTLPRGQTPDSAGNNGGYTAFSPSVMSSTTPVSSNSVNGPYHSFSRPAMTPGGGSQGGRQTPQSAYPPSRTGSAPPEHDDVADILDGY